MKLSDAANLLKLSGELTPEIIKNAYRKSAQIFHPDKNPAGGEMMKMINEAYAVLKSYKGNISVDEGVDKTGHNYSDQVSKALEAVIELDGIEIEICGAWVWVSGDSYPHRKTLKEAAFRYAGKKKTWYFRPDDWESKARGKYTMDEIRDLHGSVKPEKRKRKAIANA